MKPCRLLIDGPNTGPANMAIDEAILDEALARPERGPTLRWYRWSPATLSLGYFQVRAQCPFDGENLAIVRRSSGGGAILHDREWTYSLVFPPGAWPDGDFRALVARLHAAFGLALAERIPNGLGITFHLSDGAGNREPAPFLCFHRRSPGDLILAPSALPARPASTGAPLQGHKFLGSAQRSRGGAILQHGSLLMEASVWTPWFPGIRDVGIATPDDELIGRLTKAIAGLWDLQPRRAVLSEREHARAIELAETKYGSPTWTHKR